MAVSKAQQRATAKYVKANYDRMEIVVPKGTRETIKNHAATHEESVGAFIKRAIDGQMERDAGGPQEAGAVSLPPDTLKAAQEAAEAAGQSNQQYILQAIRERIAREAIGCPIKPAEARIVSLPSGDEKGAGAASEGRTEGKEQAEE